MISAPAYEVVYDAARLVFPGWPVATLGVAVAALGAGLGAYARRRATGSPVVRTVATSAVVFGAAWALLLGGGLYAQHAQLRRALSGTGVYVSFEGIVHDRPRGGSLDPAGASWVVESGEVAHWYRYDRSPLSVGYRRSAPGTGGLTNGARVRIVDVGGRIARVEVER
ncbi:MAG TPA: hypothetical protein VFZ21_11590 [Gemmatimonadaceae bacterium]|nr:hypothetical protein [Gemmatimonadaceae bacterium]